MPAHRHVVHHPMRRLATVTAGLGIALTLASAWAFADAPNSPRGSAHQALTSPQPASNADYSGHGANQHGPYDSTRSGGPALNGNGHGDANGKPCAGCVGKADNKNPHGQQPGGSDHNSGYECDSNHGVGQGNPAHTGCKSGTPTPEAHSSSPCKGKPSSSSAPTTEAPSSEAESSAAPDEEASSSETPDEEEPSSEASSSEAPDEVAPAASSAAATPEATVAATSASAAAPAPAASSESVVMAAAGVTLQPENQPVAVAPQAADTVRGLATTGAAVSVGLILGLSLLVIGVAMLIVERRKALD